MPGWCPFWAWIVDRINENEVMQDWINTVFSVLASVMLFLFGLSAFADELTRSGGDRLKQILKTLTRSDVRAALTGAAASAIIQSSSAVTSMTVSLAHKKSLTERAAFTIMIGTNVGTTLTAWLVAMKVSGLGPVFITLGGLWSVLAPRTWRPWGKAGFYFGVIFLALDLISASLQPLTQNIDLAQWKLVLSHPATALLFGAGLTVLVQSSSVVSGLAILAVGQGLLEPDAAVWMVAGANVGTTSTAWVAASALDKLARQLALLNSVFNVFGVLLFASVLQPAVARILASDLTTVQQVALVNTVFNLTAAILALVCLPWLWPRIESWLHKPPLKTSP